MIFDRVAQVSFAGVDLNPVTDLRIQFSIEKNDGIQFNSATIIIYNLPENTRNVLAKPHPLNESMVDPIITVFLKAGYVGEDVQIIGGDLMFATNERAGPDWITILELRSGFNVASKSEIDLTIADKTPARTVAGRLLAPLRIDVSYTNAAEEALKNQKVAAYSTSALSFRAAHEFLDRYGLEFTIEEDGQGVVYVGGRSRDPDSGKTAENTISPQSGLVGTPQVTSTGVNVRSLLRPRMRLLQKFFVESETISSTLRGGGAQLTNEYHIIRITHIGDTRGDDWHTEITGAYSQLKRGVYEPIEVIG